jgi:hypothetical protein
MREKARPTHNTEIPEAKASSSMLTSFETTERLTSASGTNYHYPRPFQEEAGVKHTQAAAAFQKELSGLLDQATIFHV